LCKTKYPNTVDLAPLAGTCVVVGCTLAEAGTAFRVLTLTAALTVVGCTLADAGTELVEVV
jgi:hypothetical protein